ncbi:1-acyl-sn-glycerol-3-phosphate acyltransferase [Aphanothece hegewaldii CCALA 016]|uniref:1-acyl-sn-glycerol-3-phosphate acyltransferase n=1 Tax=Aphanothece hegewaldii CCALA 016 TaxID=2107694 RepID=A0A2T1M298_9CHRO|nr:1-acyl-sn-glycerol-3-phosphate acyltransferase [Aphanothece hegewaldii]PSF38881.1 1-acyl-sn-glycerol-3-phosphate acyltransferase [Aphanothece hegewaldii CCALA 016]
MTHLTSVTPNLSEKKNTAIDSRVSPWLTNLAYPLGCQLILPSYFGKIDVVGRENVPLTEPVIVAPIHRSRWDALVVPYAVGRWVSGRDLRFMVSANEMKGLQGWFIRRLGGFPVNTNRPGVGSLIHSVELLCQGEMVVIFPEGGIFRDDIVHPLKPGIARIALEVKKLEPNSGLKILPLSIHYSDPYPKWGSDVRVKIGSALPVGDYLKGDMKDNAEQLTNDLYDSLKAIHEGQKP